MVFWLAASLDVSAFYLEKRISYPNRVVGCYSFAKLTILSIQDYRLINGLPRHLWLARGHQEGRSSIALLSSLVWSSLIELKMGLESLFEPNLAKKVSTGVSDDWLLCTCETVSRLLEWFFRKLLLLQFKVEFSLPLCKGWTFFIMHLLAISCVELIASAFRVTFKMDSVYLWRTLYNLKFEISGLVLVFDWWFGTVRMLPSPWEKLVKRNWLDTGHFWY